MNVDMLSSSSPQNTGLHLLLDINDMDCMVWLFVLHRILNFGSQSAKARRKYSVYFRFSL